MNPNPENDLAARVERELKALPPLSAPPTLAPRILAAIAAREEAPWYRRAWTTWPRLPQAAALGALLAFFGGLCFGGWQVWHSPAVMGVSEKVGDAFTFLGLLAGTLNALLATAGQVAGQFGTGWIVAAVGVVALAYAACLALGSVCLRLVWVRQGAVEL